MNFNINVHQRQDENGHAKNQETRLRQITGSTAALLIKLIISIEVGRSLIQGEACFAVLRNLSTPLFWPLLYF